jgi:hypothetical protein
VTKEDPVSPQRRKVVNADIKPENPPELASRYLDVPNMPWEKTKACGLHSLLAGNLRIEADPSFAGQTARYDSNFGNAVPVRTTPLPRSDGSRRLPLVVGAAR